MFSDSQLPYDPYDDPQWTGTPVIEDDRDDQYDPEFRTDDHYCIHGTYIGHPFGADILCGYCEEGWTAEDMVQHLRDRELCLLRERGDTWQRLSGALLRAGMAGIDMLTLINELSGR